MTMQTFKEKYAKVNDSINPSVELVENTRLKMHNSSTESNAFIFFRDKTFRVVSIIACCFLLLAGIAVLVISISNQKDSSFPFNKIDNIYSAAPLADSGIYSAQITTEETEKYLGYSLVKCLHRFPL